MRVNLIVYADSNEEFRDQLLAMAAALPPGAFEPPRRGFLIEASPDMMDDYRRPSPVASPVASPVPCLDEPEAEPLNEPLDETEALTDPVPEPTPAPASAPASVLTKPARVRPSRAKGAQAAPAVAPTPSTTPPPAGNGHDANPSASDADTTDGDDEDEDKGKDGAGAGDDDKTAADDPFAADPNVPAPPQTGADAKLVALGKLRHAYTLPGGPTAVKSVQGYFNVAKFVEVPDVRGHELLTRAEAVLEALNAVG